MAEAEALAAAVDVAAVVAAVDAAAAGVVAAAVGSAGNFCPFYPAAVASKRPRWALPIKSFLPVGLDISPTFIRIGLIVCSLCRAVNISARSS